MKSFDNSLLHNMSRLGGGLIFVLFLSACQHIDKSRTCTDCDLENANQEKTTPRTTSEAFICESAQRFEGQVIGDGHCVALIKACTNLPATKNWRAGRRLNQGHIPAGAIIATFKNGRYPSKRGYHAAIFISQSNQGIWVWDQWQGKAVHKRLIRYGNSGSRPANSAEAYRIVRLKP